MAARTEHMQTASTWERLPPGKTTFQMLYELMQITANTWKTKLSQAADRSGEVMPDIYILGYGNYTFNPKVDYKQAKERVQELASKVSSATH